VKIFAVAISSVLSAPSESSEAESSLLSSHTTALNSPAALLWAGDVRVRPGDNNIRYRRRSRNKGGNHDVDTVDRQACGIPRSFTKLFIDDDGSTRYVNHLIRLRGYHDKDTVDAEIVDHHTAIASRWSIR